MISVLDIFRLRIADQYRERWRAWLNIKATLATTRGTDPQSSGSNVASINRSRHVRIVCAFDDAAGVGEDCDLMPARFEFQQKAIVDRKSTRLNSSHLGISYAVFCLKKK